MRRVVRRCLDWIRHRLLRGRELRTAAGLCLGLLGPMIEANVVTRLTHA